MQDIALNSLLRSGETAVGQPRRSLRDRVQPRPGHGGVEAEARSQHVIFLALGGIGDTVLSFAAARRLRATLPHSHMTALAMWPQSAELLADLGVFDRVHGHNFQGSSYWRSIRVLLGLRARRFDASIVAYPANRFEYNIAQWLIGARRRIGHNYRRGSDLTYMRWLLTERVDQVEGTHNVLENVKLVDAFAGQDESFPLDTSLGPLAPEYRLFADRMCRLYSPPFLGIHAGSSTYKNLQGKRWPATHFAELCWRVWSEDGLTPLLFGGCQDRVLNESIVKLCPAAKIIEGSSIRHTAALIQQCEAFASNDSALAHIATALSVPTVMVTGPTDHREVGPFQNSGCVVSSDIECSPCFRVSRAPLRCGHLEEFSCIRRVGVDQVMYELRSLLTKHNAEAARPTLEDFRDGLAKQRDVERRQGAIRLNHGQFRDHR